MRFQRQHEPGEPFWPAQLCAVSILVLYWLLPNSVTIGPTWTVIVLAVALLTVLLATSTSRHPHEPKFLRPTMFSLTAVLTLANVTSLGLVVLALLGLAPGTHVSPKSLLVAASVMWLANVLVFALWYWEIDSGGPAKRHAARPLATRDWVFTHDSLGLDSWRPKFVDYFYLSLTNATAFSPTDTLPVSAQAKLLMGLQSLVSLVTIGLVLARAVNTL